VVVIFLPLGTKWLWRNCWGSIFACDWKTGLVEDCFHSHFKKKPIANLDSRWPLVIVREAKAT
jgi:hypothetical protein